MRKVSSFVLLLVVVAFVSDSSSAQTAKKLRYQEKIEFDIITSGNAHVLSTEGCSGLRVLTIFVEPKAATESKIRDFAKEVAATFPPDYDLVIEFVSDRKYTGLNNYEENDDAEKSYHKALRGFFVRSLAKNIEKLLFFPNGTSRSELDILLP